MATDSLRTLVLAYKDVPAGVTFNSGIDRDELETDLVFQAIAGIEDPVREAVPGSVTLAKKAGIKVRMLTGDNMKTAIAVAKKCGILPDSYEH
jgi:magnesium-transporting ATPase (P-type)